jgi:5-methylcytosine-specific restriction endonuclease McrA
MSYRSVLVLDAGMLPCHVVDWRRGVTLLYTGKARLVEKQAVLRGVRWEFPVPDVLVLLRTARRRFSMSISFSRRNVLRRDRHTCQYCGVRPTSPRELTLDHVVPRSLNGRTCWENVVTCCRRCNALKAGRPPEAAQMALARRPSRPTWLSWVWAEVTGDVPDSWRAYLGLPSASPAPVEVAEATG